MSWESGFVVAGPESRSFGDSPGAGLAGGLESWSWPGVEVSLW